MPRCYGFQEAAGATSQQEFHDALPSLQVGSMYGSPGFRRSSAFLASEEVALPMSSSRATAHNFLCAPRTSFNYTVEEAAHHAQHANEDAAAIKKALAKDSSLTAQEARFFSVLATPLTFLTSTFAITAAYLEVQNGWMLAQKAKMLKEDIAHGWIYVSQLEAAQIVAFGTSVYAIGVLHAGEIKLSEEEPSQCLSQDEKPEEGSLLQDAVSDDEDAVSSSSAASESSMDPSEPSEGDMSSSYSSDFSTSSSSSSECSEEEPEEEEDEEEDEEAQGEAKRGEEGEDGEIEEQEDELADECTQEMAGTLSKTLGEARPRSEVPCCTDRWPVVVLEQLLSGGGEIPAPRTDRDRNAKQKLVAKLLCRWWYVLPDWPPKDFDYNAALAAQGYRKVPVEAFELEPDEDDQGLRKAFPVSGGFKGLYRNQQGSLIDVRPVTGRPSYDQLMLRATSELHRLVVLAYTRQLEDLDSKPHLPAAELEMRQQLRQELTKA
ncbi:unnamed protein product, partial [Symbiodinium pilosum]